MKLQVLACFAIALRYMQGACSPGCPVMHLCHLGMRMSNLPLRISQPLCPGCEGRPAAAAPAAAARGVLCGLQLSAAEDTGGAEGKAAHGGCLLNSLLEGLNDQTIKQHIMCCRTVSLFVLSSMTHPLCACEWHNRLICRYNTHHTCATCTLRTSCSKTAITSITLFISLHPCSHPVTTPRNTLPSISGAPENRVFQTAN